MSAVMGYLIITLVFGGIFVFIAYVESFLVALGIFASAVCLTGLMIFAEHLIKMG